MFVRWSEEAGNRERLFAKPPEEAGGRKFVMISVKKLESEIVFEIELEVRVEVLLK